MIGTRGSGIGARSLAVLAGLLVATLAAASAEAQATPARVLVVLAKEAPGPVDAALRDVEALRRPPFDAFRSMRVLDRSQVQLEAGTPAQVELPNGRRLRIELQQRLPDGRFRVKVSINRPAQNDYLPLLHVVASPGEPFFVAGQSYQGGTLVVGVYVGAPS